MSTRLDSVPASLDAPRVLGRLAMVVVAIACAGVMFGAVLAPVAGVAADVTTSVDEQLLDVPPLAADFERAPERSTILDRDGNVLAYLKDENRTTVTYEELPQVVIEAVVATEDESFFTHEGVNWQAIARAGVGNAAAGEVRSGASTITQQLVKSLTGDDALDLDRKVREVIYAAELEDRYSKEQILELYLNRSYFGQGAYGIGTAAEYYFSSAVGDLTLDEAALLAGLIRAPEVNNPQDDAEAAVARRNIVLSQMREVGDITAAEEAAAAAVPLQLRISDAEAEQLPFFVDYIRAELEQLPQLGSDRIARQRAYLTGGLTIRTTIDSRLSQIAQESIMATMTEPEGPDAALTAVDPRNGEIVAVGFGPTPYGEGPGETKVNPALPGLGSDGRQTGSAFKPFEVVTALREGISPDYRAATPSPYRPASDGFCPSARPGNYSDGGGGVMDMRRAVAVSSNVYFANLVDRLTGPDALVETAYEMGVPRERSLVADCSTVLGTSSLYPLDMASAFGTLANGGSFCPPHAIGEITRGDGEVVTHGAPACEQRIDPDVAALATQMLRGPIEYGTASRNGAIGRQAAGKTGTAQNYKDAWFSGYVPQLSAAVWTGYSESEETMRDPRCGNVTGGCLPTIMWAEFMRRALEGVEVESFPLPGPLDLRTPRSSLPERTRQTEEAESEPSDEPDDGDASSEESEEPDEASEETVEPSEAPEAGLVEPSDESPSADAPTGAPADQAPDDEQPEASETPVEPAPEPPPPAEPEAPPEPELPAPEPPAPDPPAPDPPAPDEPAEQEPPAEPEPEAPPADGDVEGGIDGGLGPPSDG